MARYWFDVVRYQGRMRRHAPEKAIEPWWGKDHGRSHCAETGCLENALAPKDACYPCGIAVACFFQSTIVGIPKPYSERLERCFRHLEALPAVPVRHAELVPSDVFERDQGEICKICVS